MISLIIRIIILALSMLLAIQDAIHAEGKKNVPRISMGAGITMGQFDIIQKGSPDEEWKSGYGYGGGIIFEKMLSDRFGIHSGVWYSQFELTLTMNEDSGDPVPDPSNEPLELEIKCRIFTIPVYLMTTFDLNFMSINILAGLNLSYITETYLYADSPEGRMSADIDKYMNYTQFGVGGGIELKFRIFGHIELFISAIGERYLNNLISANPGSEDYLYNVKVLSGVLLRTF